MMSHFFKTLKSTASLLSLVFTTASLLFGLRAAAQDCKIVYGDVYSIKTPRAYIYLLADFSSPILKSISVDSARVMVMKPDDEKNGFLYVAALEFERNYSTSEPPVSFPTSGENFLKNYIKKPKNENLTLEQSMSSYLERINTLIQSEDDLYSFEITKITYGWIPESELQLKNDGTNHYTSQGQNELSLNALINQEYTFKAKNSCHYNPSRLVNALVHLAKSKIEKEEYSEAIQILTNSLNISGKEVEGDVLLAHYLRGIAKYQKEDFYGAKADFTYVLNNLNNPKFKEDYWLIGWRPKEYDYTGISTPNLLLDDYYFYLSGTYFNLGDYQQALTYSNVLIEKNTSISAAYYNRALIHKKLSNKTAACLDASKAGELGEEEAYTFIKNYCN